MSDVATIGLDLAKNVFQVHAVDAAGVVILRRKLRRADVLRFFSSQPPCLVGMEACATSHYWAREIGRLGHVGSSAGGRAKQRTQALCSMPSNRLSTIAAR